MYNSKRWYLSKTIWVGIIEIVIAILGLFATFYGAGDFTLPAWVLFGAGVLKIILRYLTNSAIE